MKEKEFPRSVKTYCDMEDFERREKLRREEACYDQVFSHICGSCGEGMRDEDLLFYAPDDEWYCPDCVPSLVRCEMCGTVWDKEEEEDCPECVL